MTEAGWTRERPTKNGWYWWRFDASTSATIVRIMVCGDGSLAEMSNNGHLLLAANFDGEWLGPITPDSYQQGMAAAFKQGIEKLREREKFYTEQEAISEGQMRLTRGLQRNESSCCIHELEKLAQAAQDEKPTKEGL